LSEIRVIPENLAYLTLNLLKADRGGKRMPDVQKATVLSGHGNPRTDLGVREYNVQEIGAEQKISKRARFSCTSAGG
jgi:hypothetical protein